MKNQFRWFVFALFALVVFLGFSAPVSAADEPELRLPNPKPTEVHATMAKADVVSWDVLMLNVPEAWKVTKGKGTVAVNADTGANTKHPELKGVYRKINNYSSSTTGEDKQGHGGHTQSTMCGQKNIDGIAPEGKLDSHKVLGDNGGGNFEWMAQSLIDTAKDDSIDVWSASIGTAPTKTAPGVFEPRCYKAMVAALDAGVIMVVAGGNDGPDEDTTGFPARYAELDERIIVVSACDRNRRIADYSSRGKCVFITCPGSGITGAYLDGQYATWNGTSMATPHVSGIAMLWCAANRDIPRKERPKNFAEWLRSVASRKDNRTTAAGYGIPDATKIKVNPETPQQPGSGKGIEIGWEDLTPAAQQRLRADGIATFQLKVTRAVELVAPSTKTVTPEPKEKPPAGMAPKPGHTWRTLPGVGPGWVQDGIQAGPDAGPFNRPVPQQMAPVNVPGCPGGVCTTPAQNTRSLPWLPRLFK